MHLFFSISPGKQVSSFKDNPGGVFPRLPRHRKPLFFPDYFSLSLWIRHPAPVFVSAHPYPAAFSADASDRMHIRTTPLGRIRI